MNLYQQKLVIRGVMPLIIFYRIVWCVSAYRVATAGVELYRRGERQQRERLRERRERRVERARERAREREREVRHSENRPQMRGRFFVLCFLKNKKEQDNICAQQ